MTQDGNDVSITWGPLYLQKLNGDETQTVLKNISATLNKDNSYYTYEPGSLSANQLMTVGYEIPHFTNPHMFTPIIQLVLIFLIYI